MLEQPRRFQRGCERRHGQQRTGLRPLLWPDTWQRHSRVSRGILLRLCAARRESTTVVQSPILQRHRGVHGSVVQKRGFVRRPHSGCWVSRRHESSERWERRERCRIGRGRRAVSCELSERADHRRMERRRAGLPGSRGMRLRAQSVRWRGNELSGLFGLPSEPAPRGMRRLEQRNAGMLPVRVGHERTPCSLRAGGGRA
jgi:hypothetical protein